MTRRTGDTLAVVTRRGRFVAAAAAVLALAASASRAFGCELDQVGGGVDIAVGPVTGDVVVATQGLRLFRSTDGGLSYSDRWIGVEGSWPSVAFRGQDLFIAAGRWGEPNEIFLLHSTDGGTSFASPRLVYSAAPNRLIDPELLVMRDGRLVVFLTEILNPPGALAVFTVRAFRSDDDGRSWQQLPDVLVAPGGIVRIEDVKAAELDDGDLLLAYEFELQDLAGSRIEQVRSVNGGASWQDPTVVWDDVDGSDDEPGGYVAVAPDELWFVASTDEDSTETYSNAVVKRKVSNDGGLTWREKATLVDELDQIVFGGAITERGSLVLATVRSFSNPPRSLFVYHVDPVLPGPWFCTPPLFVDGFENGGDGRWSASHPYASVPVRPHPTATENRTVTAARTSPSAPG